MYYLYIKTHNITGLRYLGQTQKNPFEYIGSGKRWKRHVAKHGNDISTKVLLETNSFDELKEKGIYYSKKFNHRKFFWRYRSSSGFVYFFR